MSAATLIAAAAGQKVPIYSPAALAAYLVGKATLICPPGGVTPSSGSITSWEDSSGGDRDLLPFAAIPVPVGGTINGMVAAQYNVATVGGLQLLATAAAKPASQVFSVGAYHLFIVAKLHSENLNHSGGNWYQNTGLLFCWDVALQQGGIGVFSRNDFGVHSVMVGHATDGPSAVEKVYTFTADQPILIEAQYDGTTCSVFVNSETVASAAMAAPAAMTTKQIFQGYGYGATPPDGAIGYVIGNNALFSAGDRAIIRGSLRAAYGTP